MTDLNSTLAETTRELQGAAERYVPPQISVIDLLKEGTGRPSPTYDKSLALTADGRLIDTISPAAGSESPMPPSAPFSKARFNKEEASIIQEGFRLPVLEGSKPEKGILASLKEQVTGKPTNEVLAEKFGNTVEGKIQQSVASKMTPDEQAVLLRNDDQRARIYTTRQDVERGAKVFEKFNKLVDQTKLNVVDEVVSSMTPAERTALSQEMRQMKNNAVIDFQTGKVDLPPAGAHVKNFYEKVAQKVLKPSDK